MSTNVSSVVIPLPPGYTEAIYWQLQNAQLQVSIITAVAFAVVVWDYILLLPDEISLYRSRGVWRNVAPWAFIALRYGGILATLPSLFFTSIPSNFCHFGTTISQVGAVIVAAASGMIFCIRLSAIWEFNRIIMGIVGILYLGMVASWIAVATQMRAINGPATQLFSNCVIQPIHSWNAVSFTSSVIFDCAVLFLTLLKLTNPQSTMARSRIASVLVRDGLLYFLGMAITNITVLSFEALSGGLNIELLKPLALPFSTLFTCVLGSRVFLNLRQDRQRLGGTLGEHSHSSQSRSGGSKMNAKYSAPRPVPVQISVHESYQMDGIDHHQHHDNFDKVSYAA